MMTSRDATRILQARRRHSRAGGGLADFASYSSRTFCSRRCRRSSARTVEVLVTGSLFVDVLADRPCAFFGGLAGAFIVGAVLALMIGALARGGEFPVADADFFQGIPALSWVVFAIIWFRGVEFRMFFIMVMTTLPAFTFQILDALRSMSKDLFEMRVVPSHPLRNCSA